MFSYFDFPSHIVWTSVCQFLIVNVWTHWEQAQLSCARLILRLLSCKEFFFILQKMSVKILRHVLNWVEEQTYWIASRFLMLGFELDLYSPSEYCMVYWYLYVVLIKLAEKTHFRMAVSNEPSKFVSIFICDFTSEIC